MDALNRRMKSRIGFTFIQTVTGPLSFTARQCPQQDLQQYNIKLLLTVLIFRLETDGFLDKIFQFGNGC
jgi:hypothetical protein